MLKQTFDNTAIKKVLTSKDVFRWNFLDNFEDIEDSIDELAEAIKSKNYIISPLPQPQ